MAALTHAESRRLYSWWWDGHISPKNSKWLQENLTDMDAKVKAMIKLMEEDADSFARRAEMYFKKRPEFMKMIEEFYRVYRALAERYDHATGALYQAHQTMAEAFPNQLLTDSPKVEQRTSKIHALFDPDDLQKDVSGVSWHFQAIKRNGAYSNNSDALTSKRGLKQLNEMLASGDRTDHAKFVEERARKGMKFQDGKFYSKNVEHNESANIQKNMVEEKDDTDSKTKSLQDEITNLSTNNQNLKISESTHRDEAEKEVESLCKALIKLESEKEAALLQYQQCLERVSSLEAEISRGQEDVNRLNGEIVEGATRLKAFEEHLLLLEEANQFLQLEVNTLVQKTKLQQQELVNKNDMLEKLMICIQDERTHLIYAEASLQSFQSLYYQSEVDLRMLELELQHMVQMLKNMKLKKNKSEDEIRHMKEENQSLVEQVLSSANLSKNLEYENFILKEAKETLEEEVGLHIDEQDAPQELYCPREELNDFNRKHRDLTEQVESVGLHVICLQSSVKDLQDENLKQCGICKENENKAELSEKLENTEKLLESVREKSTLIAQKCLLVSQLESMTQNSEKLSAKNSILQNYLSEANIELEGIRGKTKSLDSFQVLQDEKTSLLLERNGLLSHLEANGQCLEYWEKRHAELEHNRSCLGKETGTALHFIDDLQLSLYLEKQEPTTYFEPSQNQLATLGSQIHLLQDESCRRNQQHEEECERDKMINAEVEIFVLQRCICDMKERCLSLSTECLEHIEASVHAKKLISELEKVMLEQKSKADFLKGNNEMLITGILYLLRSLDMEMFDGCPERTVGKLLPLLLDKVQAMKSSILDIEDEKKQLVFEKIVSTTLLDQLAKEIQSALCRIHELQLVVNLQKQEHSIFLQSNQTQMDTLERQIHVLQEETRWRNRQLNEEHDKMMNAEVEIFVLQRCIHDMKERKLSLSIECLGHIEETVHAKILVSELEKAMLEQKVNVNSLSEDNEKMKMGIQCILKSLNIDIDVDDALPDKTTRVFPLVLGKIQDMQSTLLDTDDEKQQLLFELIVSGTLLEQLSLDESDLKSEMHVLEKENIRFLEQAAILSNFLLVFESISNEKVKELKVLSDEVDHLHGYISELEEVRVMTKQVEAENLYLKESIENFKRSSLILEDELNRIITVCEQMNHKVEIGKNMLSQKEVELSQADQKHKAVARERAELHKEISELRLRDEQLSSALQEKTDHAQLWEMEASALYEDLQKTAVCLALFEDKACELARSCKSLEEIAVFQGKMFNDDRTIRNADNEELKEKVRVLEKENGGQKAELMAYMSLILSLTDSISSLDDHIHSLTKLHVSNNHEIQDSAEGHLHDLSGQGPSESNDAIMPDVVVELQKLGTEVHVVNQAMMEVRRLVMMRGSSTTNVRKKSKREIEGLKLKRNLVQEDVQESKDVVLRQIEEWYSSKGVEQNDEAEASKSKHGLMMKNTKLVHASDLSSSENGTDAYGIGRRGNSEANDQILKLWEASEWECTGESLLVHKMQKLIPSSLDDIIVHHLFEAEVERNAFPSFKSQDENRLAADNLKVHKKVLESQQEGNEIIERLASDAWKLINLQARMQELKLKFENFEKANQLLGFEYDDVKTQLKEVDEAISQLVNMNRKLTISVEGCSASNKADESEERRNVRRQKITGRARRWSERVGRMELEVQRIQFIMLKLEIEYGNEGIKGFDRRKKVLLRDYLYGLRQSSRRKRLPFYACVRPTNR